MSRVMRTHTGITEWNGDFWCDSCGKRVRGITTVNGMDFCAKCYQETFGETEKDRKIVDLQSQLSEKKKEINDWKQRFNSSEERCKTFLTNAAKALELKNQNKISFAVEQLELARRRIDRLRYNENKCLNKKDCIEDCLDEIDNQIEKLKKEMK